MKELYIGDNFKIIDDDWIKIFKIESEASELVYSFLVDAIEEYENYCKREANR